MPSEIHDADLSTTAWLMSDLLVELTWVRKVNPFPNDKIYTLSNSKTLQMTISNMMKMAENSKNCAEITVGKGEIFRYQQFLLFPHCFQKYMYCRHIKTRLVWDSNSQFGTNYEL